MALRVKNSQQKKTGLNSEGIRVMTPTEWGRLQGFIGYAFLDENGHETFSFRKTPPGLSSINNLETRLQSR